MIIESLRLKNFISHAETEIYFEKGVNIIIGNNGAGKSSIVDGLKYALFGEKRGKSIQELVRKGSRELEVQLKFKNNSHDYEIRRFLNIRGKSTERDATLSEDGNVIATGITNVDRAIEEKIGISKDLFLNSVFVGQGEMDYLISRDPRERKDLFDRILGIDILTRIYEKLKDPIDELEKETSGYDDIVLQIDEARSRIKTYTDSINTLESEVHEEEKIKEKMSADLNGIDSNIENLRKQIAKIETIRDNMKKDEADRSKAMKEIERLVSEGNKISDFVRRKQEIEKNSLFINRQDARKYFAYADKRKSVMETISNLEKQVENHEKNIRNLEALKEKHNDYQNLIQRKNAIDQRLKEIEGDERDYTVKSDRINKLNGDISDLNRDLEGLKKSILDKTGIENPDEQAIENARNEENAENKKIQDEIKETEIKIKEDERDKKLLSEYSSMLNGKGICPVCGTSLGSEKAESIVEHYGIEISRKDEEIRMLRKKAEDLSSIQRKKEILLKFLDSPVVHGFLMKSETVKNRKDDLEKLLSGFERLEKIHEEYLRLKEELANMDLESMREYEDTYRSLMLEIGRTDISAIRQDLENNRKTLGEINDFISTVEMKIPGIARQNESDLAELENEYRMANEKDSQFQSLQAMIRSKQDEVERIDRRISEEKETASQYDHIMGEEKLYEMKRKETENRITESMKSIYGKKGKIESIKRSVDDLSESIKSLESRKQSIENTMHAKELLAKIRKAFDRDGIPAMIRKDAAGFMTNRTNHYLNSFSLDIDDLDIDQDFNISVFRGGIKESVDNLSGGEKTAIAFAVRLAIAEFLLRNVSVLVMDEPTTYLDEERRNSLKEIIEYSLKDEDIIPQMIMISHHREMISAADASFEVKKINGSSHVESIR